MTLGTTDTTGTHGLTNFPNELKINEASGGICRWNWSSCCLAWASRHSAERTLSTSMGQAPISTADPMHLHLYNGWGREWLQNYIFTAPAFLFWVPGVEPGTSYMLGKHSATVLCAQFSISIHLLGTEVSYVDQVSLELDPPPSDLWVAGISSLCHQVWIYITMPPKFIIGKATKIKMKMSTRY